MERDPDAAGVCVFCRRHPIDPRWRPFCSERCKLQDLAKWADGTYCVAGDNDEAPEDATETEKEEGRRQK